MKVLFLTLLDFSSFDEHNIYCDLLRELRKAGHDIYCVSPTERRMGQQTHFEEDGHLLKLRIGNTQKTNIIEKGISTVMIEPQFVAAIKKYFSCVKFDLVLYSTPPITLGKVVRYVKERDGAKTYLLLKDIFPQNAVDIGMMTKTGPKGLLYRFFRSKEKKLYAISDRIGCMSQANAAYVREHNPEIDPKIIEVCPNSIDVLDMSISKDERARIREKYGIPQEKTVFVYGGNLGKPQGIPFVLDCLKNQANNAEAFFLIVGDGTEYAKLEQAIHAADYQNVKLMRRLPKEDYDRMISACDVGLIFLDHCFTIPNFPSRLLAYMQAKLPVLACTDPNTDVGEVILDGGFGWWCESNSVEAFSSAVSAAMVADRKTMGDLGYACLRQNYSVQTGCETILKHFS